MKSSFIVNISSLNIIIIMIHLSLSLVNKTLLLLVRNGFVSNTNCDLSVCSGLPFLRDLTHIIQSYEGIYYHTKWLNLVRQKCQSRNAFIHLIENDFLNTNMHNPLIINLVSMGQRSCCKA